MIGDVEQGAAALASNVDFDRAVAGMAAGVFQEIADQPAQQQPIALDGDRLTAGLGVVMRGFLGRQRQQVEGLVPVEGGQRLEPAGEQDLVDQLVELGDIAPQRIADLGLGLLAQQGGRHGDAGERRAQFVAAIGQQQTMRAHQLLDALGRAVEALGQGRDLVASLDRDASAEIAAAQLLDTVFQPLEPATETAHHGIGADGDGRRHQREESDDPEGLARPLVHLARHQPAPVGQLQREVRAARPAAPAGARTLRLEARRRSPDHGDHAAVGVVEGEVEVQLALQGVERALALGIGRVGIG